MKGYKIAVIGGTGVFGQHIARLMEEGNEIIVTGSTVEKARNVAEENGWEAASNREAAESADIVIVSVPIEHTTDVIHEIGPHIDDDTLFCDVTSVKEAPCRAMEEYSDEVLGTHPMFGPKVDPEGQNVVLCPVKGEKWREIKQFWDGKGANTRVAEPGEHDTAMSIVQGMVHYTELVFAQALSDLDPGDLEDYATPHFRLFRDFAARTLDGSPGLYGSIQSSNLRNEHSRKAFRDAAEKVEQAIENGEIDQLFDRLGGDFDTGAARERTDRVIDTLDEL